MKEAKKLLDMPGDPTALPIAGESDEDYCIRRFGKDSRKCQRCDAVISWPGLCDRCNEWWESQNTKSRSPRTTIEQLEAAGVPLAYSRWTWSGVELPDGTNLSDIRAWDGEPPLMLICGPTGTGKTGVSVCMARDWILNEKRVRWRYVPDYMDYLRWLEHEGDSYHELQSMMRFDGLLVLDEIASRRITDYGIDRLIQMIDGRGREVQPTLLTSNWKPEAFRQMDDRIESRLRGGKVVVWAGRDRRKS